MAYYLLHLGVLALGLVATTSAASNEPTVTIANGVVIGTATRIQNQPSNTGLVNAYLGVPFADSPPLRFAPPTEPKKWQAPLKAQTFAPACLQQFPSGAPGNKTRTYFNNPDLPPPAESEDCMYLNVYAPQDACATNLKPVMFWVFGGNLAFGTGSLAYYNGSSLAVNEDVVVVAANYRTNMFGFSQSPELAKGKQNAGYLDQRLALEWVQKNIAQFGGDPTKVTLFGESAGGYSIRDLLAHPPSPLPFRAAIMESEAFLNPSTGSYLEVVAHFGCTLAPSPLACLRKVDGIAIRDYISQNTISFGPVDDGITHSANVLLSIQSGTFAKVPIFIGTNENEGRVFANILGLEGVSGAQAFLQASGVDISSIKTQVPQQYSPDISNAGFLLASAVLTDVLFTCRARALSEAIAKAGRQPVWRYQYRGVFPNVSPLPDAGAYHTVEIPSVWGTYPLNNQFGTATPIQVALSSYMQGVWAGFAKDPSAGPGWPKLGSAAGVELGILGGSKKPTGEQTVPLSDTDVPCALFFPVLLAANLAY